MYITIVCRSYYDLLDFDYIYICSLWTSNHFLNVTNENKFFLNVADAQVQLWRFMRALTAFSSLRGTGLAVLLAHFGLLDTLSLMSC